MESMIRNRVALALLFVCVAAAPFFKSFLQRHGASTAWAYLGGFALLAAGAIVARLARA